MNYSQYINNKYLANQGGGGGGGGASVFNYLVFTNIPP